MAKALRAEAVSIVDRRRPCRPSFGGDQDDAISATRAIDGGGGSVLQHLQRFNVIGVDGIDIDTLDAIYHDERIVAADDGVASSYADGGVTAG